MTALLYLEKFASAILTPPGLFILIFLIIAVILIRKGEERRTKVIGIVVIVLCFFAYLLSTGLGTHLYLQPLERAYTAPRAVNGQAIVVLSSGIVISPEGQVLDNHTVARLSKAYTLHLQTKLPIIVTGSFMPGRSTSTVAELMRDWLLDRGVESARVIVEPRAQTTWENAHYTADICSQFNWSSVILVTSAVHMKRAVSSFEKFSLRVTPFPTDYMYDHTKLSYVDFLPNQRALDANLSALHEYFGQLRYLLKSP
ncbi:ElyC/SanA/YdcF family protein [Mesotoga sp.]|uniref:YdcF family protein n=1 Tax=Mesotoga sp. TaxID=2053577 RepID=UPI001BD1E7C4|nr:YdcF family protein [Mesotoga sp.]